ncbi:MAG: peptide chain release factor 1 [Elusimicrobia bacterium RIFOXYB2_FULL_49_7]|nr:MAG: peptide chain release factor 1 [Elusimicrobia bacterium RIFOXYB2_FULL_49_7]
MGPSPEKFAALEKRMAVLNVQKSDITEHFIRSSGKGGQHVNKASTCVYLKHLPSGIEVKCEESRSQYLNRFIALRRLVERLEEKHLNIQSERQQAIEKIRRQKRKRSKRAKAKMLDNKRIHSEKKANRKVFNHIEMN